MDQCLARIQDGYLGGLLLPHYDGYSWTFWCRVCYGRFPSILLLLTMKVSRSVPWVGVLALPSSPSLA
jgi:hypothetical protein